ncbi:MurR/RpiR family transcriptional regulator [Amphibacillus sp. MSJ-3]|uniref:MurR/RpiR family transcriptional regulator n=1 Tax=Amphibacillus sp. MSJ-3 TaxID=2841505 RepID=UPI001C0F0FDC|nr:MurR/RpiR family transcriptional regulator [Amphibacillus sp. MSJ-3]MBU5595449.1 MurR/RpiR family transcriptional regulator [Amphibacillus sp. MSJ-3]
MKLDSDPTLSPSFLLEQHRYHLTKSEKKIYDYISERRDTIIYDSLTELADNSGVAEATALRFFRKLGYNGFQAFKLAYAQENMRENEEVDSTSSTYPNQIKMNMIRILEESYQLVNQEQLDLVVDLIDQSKDVVIFGIGASSIAALDMQNRLMLVGKNATVMPDNHAQLMRATISSKETVVIAISLSGSTKEIIDHVKIAKEKGAKVVALTSYLKSPLTKLADHVLLSAIRENPTNRSSLVAKVSQLYLVDLICTGLSIKNHQSASKVRQEIHNNISNKLF